MDTSLYEDEVFESSRECEDVLMSDSFKESSVGLNETSDETMQDTEDQNTDTDNSDVVEIELGSNEDYDGMSEVKLNKEVEQIFEKYSALLQTPEAKQEIEAQVKKMSTDQMFIDLEKEVEQLEEEVEQIRKFSANYQQTGHVQTIVISSDSESELEQSSSQEQFSSQDSPQCSRQESFPFLPQYGPIKMQSLRVAESAYVMDQTPLMPWRSCIVEEKQTGTSRYTVKLDETRNNSNESLTVSGRHLAYQAPSKYRLPVGMRCIALFNENSETAGSFYSAIIAESPTAKNKNRYLVFYDDGYAAYLYHEDLRAVVASSPNVWTDVPPDSQEFTRMYLQQCSSRPMVRLAAGQQVETEAYGEWMLAKVLDVDASLVKLELGHGIMEWVYRGSTRLKPMFIKDEARCAREMARIAPLHNGVRKKAKEVTNWEGKAKVVSEDINQKTKLWHPHSCDRKCMSGSDLQYDDGDDKGVSLLLIPILHGWARRVYRYENEKRRIQYVAPCGRHLRNLDEVYAYLKLTDSQMEIDFFSYDWWVKVQEMFEVDKHNVKMKDVSFGKEFVPVSLVNSIDKQYPDFLKYSTVRLPQKNVNINVEGEFLVCCDCKDDCADRRKCACWQLTIQSANTGVDACIGYVYKRLPKAVSTGIYECNARCNCKHTCLNRVAQKPLRGKLEVFKTMKRGWGIRTLTDVPQGTFLCLYVGNLYTSDQAVTHGTYYGDEYFADLDMIEVAEESKEGYECDVEDEGEFVDFEPLERKGATLNKLGTKLTKKYTSVRKCFGKNEAAYVMDAKSSGNIGRYLNHSCSPNVFVQNVFVDTHDLRFPWAAFFAREFIKAGDELCWDYSYKVGSIEGRRMLCYCGAIHCKGRLL